MFDTNHLNTDHVPPLPGPRMPLIRVTDGEALAVFTILAHRIFGVWTHWTGRTSMPCLNHGIECTGCKRELPKRWKGYLHVWDHQKRDEGFVELTPAAASMLLDQCGGNAAELRGLRVQLKRTKGGRHGRLQVQALPQIGDGKNLPAEKDPRNTLSLLWGVSVKRGEYLER